MVSKTAQRAAMQTQSSITIKKKKQKSSSSICGAKPRLQLRVFRAVVESAAPCPAPPGAMRRELYTPRLLRGRRPATPARKLVLIILRAKSLDLILSL